jgi:tetratricopeptide (TPR) repeat protein
MVEQRLPGDVACFVGRTAQLAELEAALLAAGPEERCSVVVSAVDGVRGVGTSAFAIHLAHRVKHRFPGGQLYVDLHGADGLAPEPDVVLEAVLRALDPSGELPRTRAERSERLGALLRERRALLVLDEADERQLAAWLPRGAAGGVVIASRERCDAVAPTAACELAPLLPAEAVELLGSVAGRALAPADAAATEVAARCGGLPLALRLAGGALAARADWSVATLGERLARARRELDEAGADEPAVRASFALRYELLADLQRAYVRRLGALLVLESGHAVVGRALGVEEVGHAGVSLQELVDAGLLELPLPDRYRLHPLVWELARERLDAEEPAASGQRARTVVLDAYCTLMRKTFEALAPVMARSSELDERRLSQPAALLLGDREADGAIMAVRVAHRDGAWRTAVEIAFGLKAYLLTRRRNAASVAVLRLAVDSARAMGAADAEAMLLDELGRVLLGAGELEEAIEVFERVLEGAEAAQDARGATRARVALGEAHRRHGDDATAERLLRQALGAGRRCDDLSRIQALRSLGRLYRAQERFEHAVDPLRRLVRELERRGDAPQAALARVDLGWALIQSGRREDGEREWRNALPEVRRFAPAVAHRLVRSMQDPDPLEPKPEGEEPRVIDYGDDPVPFERALYAAYGSASADPDDELGPTLMRQVMLLRTAGRLLSCDFSAVCETEDDGILRLMLFAESLYMHLHATVSTAAVLLGRRAVPTLTVRGLADLQRTLAQRPDHPLAPRLHAVEREMTLLRWFCTVRNKALVHRAEGDYTDASATMIRDAFILMVRRRGLSEPALAQVERTFHTMRDRHAAVRAMASELALQRGERYDRSLTAAFDAVSHALYESTPLDFDVCRRTVAEAEMHDLVVSPAMLDNADAALATLIELIPLGGGRAAG